MLSIDPSVRVARGSRARPGNLPAGRALGQTEGMPTSLPIIVLACAAAAFAAVFLHHRHRGRRQRAVRRLLDAADALEARLRSARDEIEAVTGSTEATRDALQEMLRQRLWLQQHGHEAPIGQIDDVRQMLKDAGARLDRQLHRVERARDLAS